MSTREKGGLGILDLERFTRALRLRWLWFKWKQKQRAWNNLEIPCDKYDHDIFNASTVVNVGDGKIAALWTSPWIEGNTARNIAPSLYQKTCWKKNHSPKGFDQ
jgi:hypothetical protein